MGDSSRWEIRVYHLPNYEYYKPILRDNKLMIEDRKTLAKGFCDCYGSIVVPCIYDFVNDYKWGRTIVCKEKKYAMLDETGGEVTPLAYALIKPGKMSGTYVAVLEKGLSFLWGVLDLYGNVLVPFEYYNESDLPDYHASEIKPQKVIGDHRLSSPQRDKELQIDGRNVVMQNIQNRSFGIVLSPLYIFRFYVEGEEDDWDMDYLYDSDFSPGFTWGVCDDEGNVLLPPEYEVCFVAQGEGPIGFTAKKPGEDKIYFVEFVQVKGIA